MRMIRCPRCKAMYEYGGVAGECCPNCRLLEEHEYSTVREYVKTHPGTTMEEVSRIFGVPHSKVIQYLREERLEIVKISQSFLHCDKCNRVIVTGVRCDDCKKKYGHV